ncbi:permease of the major facilitator superfamily [Vibrio astriarenae]|nr:permease of the major facilitator superfamily [Vibrio sp. C7]
MLSQKSWKTPHNFLIIVSIIVPIAFSSWMALLNNFVIEKANFDGSDIGILQSVREIPGFLAFTAIFLLAFIREQRFMLLSLAMLTLGVALTGFFPSFLADANHTSDVCWVSLLRNPQTIAVFTMAR